MHADQDWDTRRLWAADIDLARQAAELAFERSAPPERLTVALADPAVGVWAAVRDAAVIGAAVTHVLPRIDGDAPMTLLYTIDVTTSHRRRGVARSLIDAIREDAQDGGRSKLWLVTNASNEAAMRLYESAGLTRYADDDVVFGMRTSVSQ